MKDFEWNSDKSLWLKSHRGVSFEDVVVALELSGYLLDVLEHPNKDKYPGQRMFIVSINNYAFAVPFVENGRAIFLKTIFPSRKYTKKYLNNSKGGVYE